MFLLVFAGTKADNQIARHFTATQFLTAGCNFCTADCGDTFCVQNINTKTPDVATKYNA
jgi:hypothetical protein